MAKWIKKSGVEIETNDLPANIAKAEELGWERVDDGDEGTGQGDDDPDNDESEDVAVINSIKTKDELETFVRESYGIELDKRKSLENMKAEAIEQINGNG